jgi:hypothetical protein
MDWGASWVEEDSGQPETVVFALPKNLLHAMDGNQGRGPRAGGQGPH